MKKDRVEAIRKASLAIQAVVNKPDYREIEKTSLYNLYEVLAGLDKDFDRIQLLCENIDFEIMQSEADEVEA